MRALKPFSTIRGDLFDHIGSTSIIALSGLSVS